MLLLLRNLSRSVAVCSLRKTADAGSALCLKPCAKAFSTAWLRLVLSVAIVAGSVGCAHQAPSAGERPFQFGKDNFSFANELVWQYRFDDSNGATRHELRQPRPEYTHHCFVVARSARQFFQHARFDESLPKVGESEYRELVERVVASNLRAERSPAIVIPCYPNLFAFSRDYEHLLKETCGSAWQSYFQRGHWRMILPFTKGHQESICRQLMRKIEQNRGPLIHIVRFPQLSINHAMLLFACRETPDGVLFDAYDPNDPRKPALLRYSRKTRTFMLARNDYFKGGKVNVYEIYHTWNY